MRTGLVGYLSSAIAPAHASAKAAIAPDQARPFNHLTERLDGKPLRPMLLVAILQSSLCSTSRQQA